MSGHRYCHVCKTATPERGMIPYGEWNQDARRTLQHLACPCGEREDIVEAFECTECEEHFPESGFDTGMEYCIKCAAAKFGVW